MNPNEHARLTTVSEAIRRILPGAVMSYRPSDYGNGTSEVVTFRVGPRRAVEILADSEAWFAVSGDAVDLGAIPLESRAPVALGVPASATAEHVAAAFVQTLQRQAGGWGPGDADPGLVEALRVLPPLSTPWQSPATGAPLVQPSHAPAPYMMASTAGAPRSRRGLTIVLASVAAVALLGIGAAGGFALAGVTGSHSADASSGYDSGDDDGATGTTAVTTLSIGDCFDAADAFDSSDKILPKSCTAAHDGEVFATITIPDSSDATGRESYDEADVLCLARFEPYVGDSYNDSGVDFDVFTPSAGQYDSGDRKAYCYIELDDPLSKSVKDSGL